MKYGSSLNVELKQCLKIKNKLFSRDTEILRVYCVYRLAYSCRCILSDYMLCGGTLKQHSVSHFL